MNASERRLRGRAVCRSRPDANAKNGWHEEWFQAHSGSVSGGLWTTNKADRKDDLDASLARSIRDDQRARGQPVVRVLRVREPRLDAATLTECAAMAERTAELRDDDLARGERLSAGAALRELAQYFRRRRDE